MTTTVGGIDVTGFSALVVTYFSGADGIGPHTLNGTTSGGITVGASWVFGNTLYSPDGTNSMPESYVTSAPGAQLDSAVIGGINTNSFIAFHATYHGSEWNHTPQSLVALTPNGSQVTATWNETGSLTSYTATPGTPAAPTTPPVGSNNAPVQPSIQTYGQIIPVIWGTIRLDGSPIWQNTPYGGVAGLAIDIAVSYGTPLFPTATFASKKLYGNNTLFYDFNAGGSSIGALSLIDYPGTETQAIDPTIQAAQGSLTPAFRGLVYSVIKGLPLATFNNVTPTISDLLETVSGARIAISDVLKQFTVRGGFDVGEFVTSGIDDECDGGALTTSTDLLTLLKSFSLIYNFSILEHPLRLVRRAVGGSLVIDKVIALSECKASSTSDDAVSVADVEPWQLPNSAIFRYIDAALDYKQSTVQAKRPIFPQAITGTQNVQTLDLPVVVTADEAATLIWLYLYRLWVEARTLTATLLPMHMDIEPGDVIQIPCAGKTYTVRVTKSVIGTDFSNTITASVLFANTTVSVPADPGTHPSVLICPTTPWTVFDASTSDSVVITNCGLTVSGNSPGHGAVRSSSYRTNGKYFFQMHCTAGVNGNAVAIAESGADYNNMQITGGSLGGAICYWGFPVYSNDVATSVNVGVPFTRPGTISVACDLDHSLIWFALDTATFHGDWNGSPTADPITGVGGVSMSIFSGQPMSPVALFYIASGEMTANFGQSIFTRAVPNGFTGGWPA